MSTSEKLRKVADQVREGAGAGGRWFPPIGGQEKFEKALESAEGKKLIKQVMAFIKKHTGVKTGEYDISKAIRRMVF